MYILIEDINEELASFIHTGKTEHQEFQVLPQELENEMTRIWAGLGYEVRYYRQRLDYMRMSATIKYLRVRNPESGVAIALIPWFLVPGRPYPVFAYIYAIWYYHHHGKKSLGEAAKATGKLFKIDSFNKSTVSRSIKAMENFIDMSQIDRQLSAEAAAGPPGQEASQSPDVPHPRRLPENMPAICPSGPESQTEETAEERIGHASLILKGCASIESAKEACADKIEPLPGPVNAKATISGVLGAIPPGHGHLVVRPEPDARPSRDARKRPPRPRKEEPDPVQRPGQCRLRFVDDARREEIRAAFIETSRRLVLDAAATYHRFLV